MVSLLFNHKDGFDLALDALTNDVTATQSEKTIYIHKSDIPAIIAWLKQVQEEAKK